MNDLEKRVKDLEDAMARFNHLDSAVFDKKLVSKDIFVAEKHGIKLVSPDRLTWVEIHHGSQINDTDIKAEIGYTSPSGSLYLSSSPTQPLLIMIGSTWTLLNIP